MDRGAWWAAVHGVARSRTWLSDFTFTFHFYALEKEMATHSSILAWRVPGTGEPGGLPSMGSHRIGHDWSDLAAAAAAAARASKVTLKVLQARLQQYVNCELPDVQAAFREGRGTRDQITNIHWIIKKQEYSRKISTPVSLTMLKPLTVWITTDCGKFFKRWEEFQVPPENFRCPLRNRMQVKKQQLEPDMEQQTGSKSGKEYVKAVYWHHAYLIYMQSISWEMPGWI